MATTKFKDASPYSKKHKPSTEDYLYAEYEADVTQDLSKKSLQKPINIAIFGLGRAGSIHLSNIVRNPRTNLLYIVDDVTSKWDAMKTYWNFKSVTFLTSTESDKVFTDTRVDAVIVASPTFTHEGIVTKALNYKKSVFCEKPVAENMDASARCYLLANKVGKPLFSAFNRRFDPSFSAVRDRVRKGEVGHVQVIKVCSRDSPLPSIDYLSHSGKVQPLVKGYQTLAVSKIATAMEQSARTGQIVKIPWTPEELSRDYS